MSSGDKAPQPGYENTGTNLESTSKQELQPPYPCKLKLDPVDPGNKGSSQPTASHQSDGNGTKRSSHERQRTSSSSYFPVHRVRGTSSERESDPSQGRCSPMSKWLSADAKDGPWNAIAEIGTQPVDQRTVRPPLREGSSGKVSIWETKGSS